MCVFVMAAATAFAFSFQESGKQDPEKAKQEAQKKEWSLLNGKWILERIESDAGLEAIPAGLGQVVFDNEKYAFKLGAGEQMVREEGTMLYHPDKKPKLVDIKILVGPDKGKAQFGVYEIDGNMLRLCVAKAGLDEKTRPAAIKRKEGADQLLFVFKREPKPGVKI